MNIKFSLVSKVFKGVQFICTDIKKKLKIN